MGEQLYETLEREFADWAQQDPDNTVACASGTAALQLAVESLLLPKGSMVLIPEFCMISVARACTMAGLKPFPIDCHAENLNIDPDLLPIPTAVKACDVRAIIVVHTYGRLCDMERIHKWAASTGCDVIEDMAEAPDKVPHSETAAACWSFYRNKIIHGEEGGMVAFREKKPAALAKQLRSCGFTPEHEFMHLPGGFNGRMSNSHAVMILNSLHRSNWAIERRAAIARIYDRLVPQDWRMPERDSNWVYDLRVPKGLSYNAINLVRKLRNLVPGARMAFKPVSEQPEYYSGHYDQTNAYTASRQVFYLPNDPHFQEYDLANIADHVESVRKELSCRG